jgi:hypothetical protein
MAPASSKYPPYLTEILANVVFANEALETLRAQVRQSLAFNEVARIALKKAQTHLAEAKG